jgi:hypothetical protein
MAFSLNAAPAAWPLQFRSFGTMRRTNRTHSDQLNVPDKATHNIYFTLCTHAVSGGETARDPAKTVVSFDQLGKRLLWNAHVNGALTQICKVIQTHR